jgi:hypothetical protein
MSQRSLPKKQILYDANKFLFKIWPKTLRTTHWGGYLRKILDLAFNRYDFGFGRQKYPRAQKEIEIEQSQHYPVHVWGAVEINIQNVL